MNFCYIKNIIYQLDLYNFILWIIAIIITGFIGQFGRIFAEQIITNYKKNKKTIISSEETKKYLTIKKKNIKQKLKFIKKKK